MNYLQDQVVQTYAGTAARGSAIGTAVSEGMVSYLADTDSLEVYRAIGTASPGWDAVAFADNVPTLNGVGLIPVVPSSVVIATGSGSANDLGVVSFSGATAISLNNVFSSTYSNYLATINITPSSNGTLQMRLRSSGTDNSSANYGVGYFTFTTSGAPTTGGGGNTQTIGTIGLMNTNGVGYVTNIFNAVTTARYTHVISSGMSSLTAAQSMNGYGVAATTFDGLTLIPSTGTLSGTIQVFGYNG
jgi:hypothetical protein